MNLWVKRTGQLLVAVLFLMSCEDDSFLLGFRNQNKKFNIRHQEFILPSSVVLIDSLITDNYSDPYRLLIGEYVDPQFGTVHAEAYTQIQAAIFNALEADADFDSLTIQLSLDFYSYGSVGESEERFTIHEIIADSISTWRNYYYNSSIDISDIGDQVLDYDMFSLGEASSIINYDTLSKRIDQGSSAPPILFKLRLDDSFGEKLFNVNMSKIDSTFDYKIKGLAIIPSQSSIILGISPASAHSKLVLHYHTQDKDSLIREFNIRPPVSAISFNKIATTRTGELAGMTKYSGYEPPSGKRYLQNGSPVITKLDIRGFYDFITGKSDGVNDSLTNMVINSAEITMDAETPPPGMSPPTSLQFRIMKEENDEFKYRRTADSTGMNSFYITAHANVSITRGRYYSPIGDVLPPPFPQPPQVVTLQYNSSTKKYSGFVTLFMQNLFDQKERDRKNGVVNPVRVEYLGLMPVSPSPGKTLSRAVIMPNSIKLEIDYTSPIAPNL